MRRTLHWFLVVVIVLHGPIHLLGAAEGPHWLIAALLVTAAGILVAVRAPWWWAVTGAAAVVSQAVIFTAWTEAIAGTLANVIMLVAAGYGFASQGPKSHRAEYRRRVGAALRDRTSPGPEAITEADLMALPEPVATYVRRSGAVGRPPVTDFHATIKGRIRSAPGTPWMPFTGEQFDLFGPAGTRRFFRIDASMMGVPVDVLHVFDDREEHKATMRGRICSVVPILDAAGAELDKSETVTVFNDLCVMAPAALIDAPISWNPIDGHRVEGSFTSGDHTVTAELVFNEDGDLVDFVSDDRSRSSKGGKAFAAQRWSTPLQGYRVFGDGRRVAAQGSGVWHAPDPEGGFPYAEFTIVDIAHNVPAPAHGRKGDGDRGPIGSGGGTGRQAVHDRRSSA